MSNSFFVPPKIRHFIHDHMELWFQMVSLEPR